MRPNETFYLCKVKWADELDPHARLVLQEYASVPRVGEKVDLGDVVVTVVEVIWPSGVNVGYDALLRVEPNR